MPRKSNDTRLKEVIDAAIAAPNEKARQAVISRAAKKRFVAPAGKRCTSKPSPYTERLAVEICERIARGETLPEIVPDLKISINTVYDWIKNDTNGFNERYRVARLQMAESLVDNLLLETKKIEKDQALAAKVRASIIQWYSGKVHPVQFGDSRRLELKAEINHTHSHNLTVDQKRRIAESWLLSQSDKPLIEAETTGPDLPVQTVADSNNREIPRRKALEAPKPKRKIKSDDDW